jgi:hypothetical protein
MLFDFLEWLSLNLFNASTQSVRYFFYVLPIVVFPFDHDRNLMKNYLITAVIFLLTFFLKRSLIYLFFFFLV